MQIWEPGQQDILVLELKQYYVQILGKYSHDFFSNIKSSDFYLTDASLQVLWTMFTAHGAILFFQRIKFKVSSLRRNSLKFRR